MTSKDGKMRSRSACDSSAFVRLMQQAPSISVENCVQKRSSSTQPRISSIVPAPMITYNKDMLVESLPEEDGLYGPIGMNTGLAGDS